MPHVLTRIPCSTADRHASAPDTLLRHVQCRRFSCGGDAGSYRKRASAFAPPTAPRDNILRVGVIRVQTTAQS